MKLGPEPCEFRVAIRRSYIPGHQTEPRILSPRLLLLAPNPPFRVTNIPVLRYYRNTNWSGLPRRVQFLRLARRLVEFAP